MNTAGEESVGSDPRWEQLRILERQIAVLLEEQEVQRQQLLDLIHEYQRLSHGIVDDRLGHRPR